MTALGKAFLAVLLTAPLMALADAKGAEAQPLASGAFAGGATTFAVANGDRAVELTATTDAEAVEFFFIPDGGAFEYYSFHIAKDGTKNQHFYSEFGGIEPDPFGAVWQAKVEKAPEGGARWKATATIPLSGFYWTRWNVWKTTWKVNVAAYAADGKAKTWSGGEQPTAKAKFLATFKEVKGLPAPSSPFTAPTTTSATSPSAPACRPSSSGTSTTTWPSAIPTT